jgi:hypothetical protein
MRRLLALALVLVGCSDGERNDEMPTLSPWHMWGNSVGLRVNHTLALQVDPTLQVARIAYGRPETWNFLLVARILSADILTEAGRLEVNWKLTAGLGRSQTTFQSWERYLFIWTPGNIPINVPKYSTQVLAPQRDDAVVAANVITEFVAQDIQLQATARYTDATTPIQSLELGLDAYFAPKSHIRPEWYRGEFPGGEDHGQ